MTGSAVSKSAAVLVLFLAAFVATAAADTATLTVDAGKPGPKISPTLFGIFFEEINHAGDGGLYAEMVRNRSFEDRATPDGWSLVKAEGAEANMALDTEKPLNGHNPRSLRLEIAKTDSWRVGIANGGYWGMSVVQGAEYDLSLFARCSADFKSPLTVRLESVSGNVLAETTIKGLTSEWNRYSGSLTAKAADRSARLVIAAASPGTLWFDMVSLFPQETFKRRPNGLRADLAGMLADLRPAFIRFPGGCFVEGDKLDNATRWKNTIGDVAERPGHWNLWGYRSTDGLGYHEYLQMCEDIGAEPLFVINCGMAHGGNVPLDQLGPWVQDALDAIEYANGPETTKWGSLRAKNGHPNPFGLKYLEIGNENGGPAYNERYARFYDAIKARYPEMQLIADTRVPNRPMDILDEHYYNNPGWFAANAERYDTADRKGPKIYVGEYACTSQCGRGNLRAALGEAAFMTGMERNSDIVTLCSYAPLFVNVNDRKWNPDAICFNSATCYGTPSYYVQKLFAQNRGDVALPLTLHCSTPPVVQGHGAIGLGTWATQAEYKDIRVTRGNETLLTADFAKDASGWRVVRGDWIVADGTYRQMDGGTDDRTVAGDPKWTDYTYSLKARKIGGAEGFLIMFNVQDNNNWLWWNIGGWGNSRHAIEKCTGGGKSELGRSVRGKIETDRWYDIRIELQGPRIRCYLDGKLIHDVRDTNPPVLIAGASRTTGTNEIILKVINTSGAIQDTDLSLLGLPSAKAKGVEIVLTSASPEDENSLEQPTRIAPKTKSISSLGTHCQYSFAPYSLTILRIEAGK